MELKGDDGVLRLECALEPDAEHPDEDLLLNVTVSVGGYSAADQCWVMGRDWERFLVELSTLEQRRKGRSIVEGASPHDFRLEFFATDSVGHMAVRGHIGWQRREVHALRMEFSFDFEPDRLPSLVREFESIGEEGRR